MIIYYYLCMPYRWLKKYLGEYTMPLFIFLSLAVLVAWPLVIEPGYLLLLDWAHAPCPVFTANFTHSAFFLNTIFWLLQCIIPGGQWQGLFLIGLCLLVGFGMFRFILRLGLTKNRLWGAYFGGFLFLFNPFVYSRLLAGQLIVILSYAFLPFLFSSLVDFFYNPRWSRSFRVALWWTCISVTSVPLGAISLIALFVVGLLKILSSKQRWLIIRGYIVIGFFYVVLNCYWLIPALIPSSYYHSFITTVVTSKDIFSFFTRPDPQHGVLWNTAAMYGFWGDDDQRYISQKTFVPYWFYLFFALFALVAWGVIVSLWRLHKRRSSAEEANLVNGNSTNLLVQWWFILSLLLIGLVAFIFAVGISYESFKLAVLWLHNNVPFFKGFREPQKFVSLLVFVYACFGAIGIDDLLGRIEKIRTDKLLWLKFVAPGLFLLIPLAYSPGMFWGFHGQIKTSHYPANWFAVDNFIINDNDNFRVLFLPWHGYINLSFAHGIVANPAEVFFHKPTIAGDNMEFGPIYTQSSRPESRYIEDNILAMKEKFIPRLRRLDSSADNILTMVPPELSLGETLNQLNIKYVILAQESDYFNYNFIAGSPDMESVFRSPELIIYKNLSWRID